MDPKDILSALNGQMIAFAQSNLGELQAAQRRFADTIGFIDSRAIGAAVAGGLIRSDNSDAYANLNAGVRTPTTIEHIPYPGATNPSAPK